MVYMKIEEQTAARETNFLGLGTPTRGKVRDIYDLGEMLLIVATDRISAFDENMPNPIPGKGEVLTLMSAGWFRKTEDIIWNHLLSVNPDRYPLACEPYRDALFGRSMLVRKANPLPVECVVRGYLSGSAWTAYKKGQPICGIKLPTGLVESDRLPEPIFTPATKAPQGSHDENIDFGRLVRTVGENLAYQMKSASLRIYDLAWRLAISAGIIIADTKLEFGICDGQLMLIDELLTPDSSRFWPADQYRPGGPQPSFDKQFLRDWLISVGWDQKPPAPELPQAVIDQTAAKYAEAWNRLSRVLNG